MKENYLVKEAIKDFNIDPMFLKNYRLSIFPFDFWTQISSTYFNRFNSELLDKYKEVLRWGFILGKKKMSSKDIIKFDKYIVKDSIAVNNVITCQILDENIINSYYERKLVNLSDLLINQKLTKEFIENNLDKIIKDKLENSLSESQLLSEEFILEHLDILNRDTIISNQILTPKLIKELKVDYEKDSLFLKKNLLYVTNINKPWFLCFLMKGSASTYYVLKFANILEEKLGYGGLYLCKGRVYYDDLILTSAAKKAEILHFKSSILKR